jgi:hypothetical protein
LCDHGARRRVLSRSKVRVEAKVLYEVLTEGLFAGAPAYGGYGKAMVDESYHKVGSPIKIGIHRAWKACFIDHDGPKAHDSRMCGKLCP